MTRVHVHWIPVFAKMTFGMVVVTNCFSKSFSAEAALRYSPSTGLREPGTQTNTKPSMKNNKTKPIISPVSTAAKRTALSKNVVRNIVIARPMKT